MLTTASITFSATSAIASGPRAAAGSVNAGRQHRDGGGQSRAADLPGHEGERAEHGCLSSRGCAGGTVLPSSGRRKSTSGRRN